MWEIGLHARDLAVITAFPQITGSDRARPSRILRVPLLAPIAEVSPRSCTRTRYHRYVKPSPTQRRAPMWGNLIGHADEDVIGAAVLYAFTADCWGLAHFHMQQAIEKYLKALVVSFADPDGTSRYEQHKRKLE